MSLSTLTSRSQIIVPNISLAQEKATYYQLYRALLEFVGFLGEIGGRSSVGLFLQQTHSQAKLMEYQFRAGVRFCTRSKYSSSLAFDEDTSVVHKARLLYGLAYGCWGRANQRLMILWTNEMFLLLEISLPGIHHSSTCAEPFSSLEFFLQCSNAPNHDCSKRRPNCRMYIVERGKCVRLCSWS